MKKNFKYAFMSAIALLGAVSFTACQSSDEIVENPNYDPETNMVNTQFVLNVASYPTKNATRQSSATVQKSSNFRGLKDAQLIAMTTSATGIANFGAPYQGGSIASENMEAYNMGDLYTSDYLGSEPIDNTAKSHRILRMKLPVGSDAMLVYARAIPNGTKEANGKVVYNVNTVTPASTSFELVPRIGDNETKYNNTCTMIQNILNYILDASVGAQTGGYQLPGKTYSVTEDLPAIAWKDLSINDASMLIKILAGAYDKLTNIADGEYRDGSAVGVFYQIFNLAIVIDNTLSATSTSPGELNAQRLAVEIDRRIDLFFTGTTSEELTKFQTMEQLATAFVSASLETTTTSFTSKYTISDDDLKTFPASLGLPNGVALLYSTNDKKLTYQNESHSLVHSTENLAANKYMYPAELLYFDNSTLRVNDNEVEDIKFPDGYSNWNTDAKWNDNGVTGWTVGSISTSTKSIAVRNNINYGVAMLKTNVAKASNVTTFEDNRKKLTAETSNQSFSSDDLSKMKLNGILIGGQNNVGWNYLSSESTAGDKIIYDNVIVDQTIPTPGSGETYTLLFDNYINNADQAGTVYVALEFKNGPKAFYGEKNLIQANGYFYLVGELKLSEKKTGSGIENLSWDEYYPVPPYNTDGSSMEVERIFIQDHVTAATFTLGQYSFQHAFLTVPDMREVQTSLGLSVDLQWLPGLTFETTLGGGEIQ